MNSVTPEALAQIFTEARTHNGWLPEPVSADDLKRIWDVAKFPPSSANTMRLPSLRTPSTRAPSVADSGGSTLRNKKGDATRTRSRAAPVMSLSSRSRSTAMSGSSGATAL